MKEDTFFGIFGLIVQNSLRWIILIGRRYQIIPAFYLVVFFVGIIGHANQPVSPPPPIPTPSNTPSSSPATPTPDTPGVTATPTTNPTSTPTDSAPVPNPSSPQDSPSPTDTSPTPTAVTVAQPKVYKHGNILTVRFDKLVSQVGLLVDEVPVTINCEVTTCTTTLPEGVLKDATQAEVYWYQGTENFSTKFRLLN